MKHISTKGIVLSRIDYGEADRIIKFLTPDHGKVTVIAKGVRKSKSKLAGSIELFSESEITYIVGKSEIYTLISARLVKHYGNIIKEIERTNAGYDFIRVLNIATEQATEHAYFNLLSLAFEALDDLDLDPSTTSLWFNMQLLRLAGHTPDLQKDTEGSKLDASNSYNFELDQMHFMPGQQEPFDSAQGGQGVFNANHIKFLRLGFSAGSPKVLHRVENSADLTNSTHALILTMLKNFTRA